MDRIRARCEDRASLAAQARAALPELVAILVQEYGARRVVLFGSLLGPAFCETSDIDLLVEGLPAQRYGEALGRLFAVAPVAVDLIPLETGRPAVVARALAEGEVLHAA